MPDPTNPKTPLSVPLRPGVFSPQSVPLGVRPPIVVNPKAIEAAVHAMREAPPLLLLPLRLEYRVIARGAKLLVADTSREPRRQLAVAQPQRPLRGKAAVAAAQRELLKQRAEISALRHRPVSVTTLPTRGGEIWFRWYPDEGFAEKGIAPVSPGEAQALEHFDRAMGARPWHAGSDPVVAAAWQTLAGTVGPERAVHLLRTRGTAAAAGTGEDRIGRIAALPSRVALFAVQNDGTVTLLGQGADIPAGTGRAPSPVSYTPVAIEPGGWLNRFHTAVEVGMGMRLTDPRMVTLALQAQWIVAVGIHAQAGTAEVESLLGDAVANGSFAFVPQDSPTNSGAGSRSVVADPRSDLLGFLEVAAQQESGALSTGSGHAADLLAEALGIDAGTVRRAVHAADGAFEDARAMLRVVGPVLLDAVLDGVTVLEGVDENTFVNVLAAAVSARGPLPTVRFGRNPYGVLPVTRLAQLRVEGTDATARVHGFLRQYASIARTVLANRADQVVPVLEPDDPEAPAKLEEMLKLNPVSRRVDVGEVGAEAIQPLGCPYVSSASRPAAAYLADLRSKPIETLPDPDETDRSWPLLYRLARLSLMANTMLTILREKSVEERPHLRDLDRLSAAQRRNLTGGAVLSESVSGLAGKTRPPTTIPPAAFQRVRLAARDFAQALARLQEIAERPQGTAQLETLLLEVLDLFQHRVDAWGTGLAYARLVDGRRKGGKGLAAGYYGILSGLRPRSATGSGDGYVQAPSIPQATTAAVLRSAYRRHRGEGAFEIDLPSRRVRRALAILDMQKKGLSLQEVLGLRGERWLHDRKQDLLIPELRRLFPLRNPSPPEEGGGAGAIGPQPVQIRLFDGVAFIEGALGGVPAKMRTVAGTLKAVLQDDLDALSDLVMCEAVHQRAAGQAEAASAWLQVLAGEPVPGDPTFLRTQRHGQGSSHRVSVLMQPPAAPAGGSPREVAEPALAAFAARLLPSFGTLTVPVTLRRLADGRGHRMELSSAAHLGMTPLDLVVGGESELRVRVRHHAVSRWLTDPAVGEVLGALPATGLGGFLNREVAIDLELEGGEQGAAALLQAAACLRVMVQRGRPLEPADLGAAATPDRPLTEAAELPLLAGAVSELQRRALALRAQLELVLNQLGAAGLQFLTRAREVRRRVETQQPEDSIVQALAATEQARRALAPVLEAASRFSEPEGLTPFTTEEAVADPDVMDETLTALAERLTRRRDGLVAAVNATTPNAPQTRSQARSALRTLVQALQAALDGEALPVLPPVARVPETTPLLQAGQPAAGALGDWAKDREGVALALSGVAGLPGVQAFAVAADATADEKGDADPRGPEEAPPALHFGVFLGDDASTKAASFAGIVSDEWVEQRPSRTQMAALAVNYDSPQSEPPHCLLLCVPPGPDVRSWTEQQGAEMVWEVIQWMKTRALSTEEKLTPAALFPGANQVPYQKAGKASKPRVPTGEYLFGNMLQLLVEGGLVNVKNTKVLGAEGIGIHEVGGWHRTTE